MEDCKCKNKTRESWKGMYALLKTLRIFGLKVTN
jgi:hypothetical protein